MLDEDEFARVIRRFRDGQNDLPLLLEEYNHITGFEETNPNAVWHHRIALYGPPCHGCGKPLRTPVARFCAACGAIRAELDNPAA
jgi:hypothetical protein